MAVFCSFFLNFFLIFQCCLESALKILCIRWRSEVKCALKTCGSGSVPAHFLELDTVLTWVVRFTPWEEPCYPRDSGLGETQSHSRQFGEGQRKVSFFVSASEHLLVYDPAHGMAAFPSYLMGCCVIIRNF